MNWQEFQLALEACVEEHGTNQGEMFLLAGCEESFSYT